MTFRKVRELQYNIIIYYYIKCTQSAYMRALRVKRQGWVGRRRREPWWCMFISTRHKERECVCEWEGVKGMIDPLNYLLISTQIHWIIFLCEYTRTHIPIVYAYIPVTHIVIGPNVICTLVYVYSGYIRVKFQTLRMIIYYCVHIVIIFTLIY